MTRWRVRPDDDEVDEGADLHVMTKAGVPFGAGLADEKIERTARPIIKSLGGKTKLLPEILRHLPLKIRRYHEPFVGGGAVFFALVAQKRLFGPNVAAYLSDMNDDVVNLYQVVQQAHQKLISNLGDGEDFRNDEKAYYRVRASEPTDPMQRAARIMYLNKTCFNGLVRYNKKGKFNSPFGRYDNPTICDAENIRRAALAFEIATIVRQDFEKSCEVVRDGDVVYLDSPYLPLSATSNFTTYTKDGFSFDDHVRLRDVARRLGKIGAHVLISHSAAPAIRELYAGRDFKIEEVKAARSINSDATKRGAIKELLISVRSKS